LTGKELEFEAKATEVKLYRMNKLNKKRESQRVLIITLFFMTLLGALITCVVWHTWQIVFYLGFGLVCLIGLITEQLYEKRRKEIFRRFS